MIEILRVFLPSKIRERGGKLIDKYPLLFLPLMWIIFRMIIVPLFNNNFLIISSEVKCKSRNGGWFVIQEIFRDNNYEKKYKFKKGDVVIDIGANVGIFTLKVAKTIGRDGLCIAIEPDPSNFKLLEENTEQYNNIIKLQKAIGNKEGYVKLYLAKTSLEHSIKRDYGVGHIICKMETLDQIVEKLNLQKIDFIKIDVEGAEVEVLEGAKRTLSLFSPKLALEYHSIQDFHKIIKILENFCYNYEVFSKKSQLGYIYAWRE